MRWVLIVLLALASCAPRDGHVPPFARVPYEAFSRASVVAIALREWRAFGALDVSATEGERFERDPGLWQRVGEYWWLGLDAGSEESGWTGRHDGNGWTFPPDADGAYAWSAAFVSYVMRIAGAGSRFPYAADHATYINAARRGGDWVVTAEPPEAFAPRPGDLVCRGRGPATGLRFDDLPTGRFPSHCDIVVGSPEDGTIPAVGGNVGNAVTRRFLPVSPDGLLLEADPPWLTVLRVDLAARMAWSDR
jgi:hypothetical protein